MTIWTPPPGVEVVAARHAFRTETLTLEMPEGATLAEIVERAGIPAWAPARVWIDDWEFPPTSWAHVRPRPGRRVTIRAVPSGGGGGGSNKTLRMILFIVVLIVAIAITVATSGATTPLLGLTLATWGTIAAAAVMIGGSLAINALLPPPKPKMSELTSIGRASPTYALTGTRNQLAPYQTVPRVYGRHRYFPPLSAYPVTWSHLTDQYLAEMFTLGYGPLLIEDVRIGDTPISEYLGVDLQVRGGFPGDAPLTNVGNVRFEEPLGIELVTDDWRAHAGRPNSDWYGVEIIFPQGLFFYDDKNDTFPMAVSIYIEMRELNDAGEPLSDWVFILDWAFNENRRETLRFSWEYALPHRGHYEFRLKKVGPPAPVSDKWVWGVQWSAFRSSRAEDPAPVPGMGKIGLVVRATGQLSGVIDQLNVIATSILPDWDGAAWVTRATRNPAAIYLDILRGSANARPITDDQIDWIELQAWAEECTAQGYTFDAVFDTASTVFEQLSAVAAIGRASFTMRDGKYSVVRDKPQTVPVQFFTPRNSRDFIGNKTFVDIPHALKVRFVNPAVKWQMDERFVYDDGYDEATATKFEGLELFGVTSPDLAWRHGRYWLAAARLRPETYELTVDVEYLVATRGDLVHVLHDVPLWGLASGRLLAIGPLDAGPGLELLLDEEMSITPGAALALRVRLQDGTSYLGTVTAWPDAAQRITRLIATTDPLPTAAQVGDLAMLGYWGSETTPCLIKLVEPNVELSAKLTLVDAAPAIYDADQGDIPPFNSNITRPLPLNRQAPPAPTIVTVRSDEWVMLAGEPRIVVTFAIPTDLTRLPATAVQAQYRPADSSAPWRDLPTLTLPAEQVVVPAVEQGRAYDVRLRSVNTAASLASDWTLVTAHVVVGKTTPPPAPEGLTLDLAEDELRWLYPNPPPDLDGFLVRYAAGASADWDTAAPLHDAVVSDTRFHLPPLTGQFTFLVKAIDTSGIESIQAGALIADLVFEPENIVTERDYAALGFPGTVEHLTPDPGPPPELCTIPADDPLFWGADSHVFWGADTHIFWEANHGPGAYTTSITFLPEDAGTTLTWLWHATNPGWIMEYRSTGDSAFWAFDAGPMWSTDSAPFWSAATGWVPWPGAITVAAQRYDFRWRFLGGSTGGCLDAVTLRLDVPDRDEYIPNVAIASGGSRIPVATAWRAITTVLLTVQQAAPGDPLKTATVLDKDLAGPLVALNLVPSGAATAGVVDAHIRGY